MSPEDRLVMILGDIQHELSRRNELLEEQNDLFEAMLEAQEADFR